MISKRETRNNIQNSESNPLSDYEKLLLDDEVVRKGNLSEQEKTDIRKVIFGDHISKQSIKQLIEEISNSMKKKAESTNEHPKRIEDLRQIKQKLQ
jgi:hypothetical protein